MTIQSTNTKNIDPEKLTAEQMNARLAMMGLFAAVINYGFTGWIVPGIL